MYFADKVTYPILMNNQEQVKVPKKLLGFLKSAKSA
jgi:hypothetical protein